MQGCTILSKSLESQGSFVTPVARRPGHLVRLVGLGGDSCLCGAWDTPELSHNCEGQCLPDGVSAGQVVVHAHCLCGADEGSKLLVSCTAVQTKESCSIGALNFILGDVESWSHGDGRSPN